MISKDLLCYKFGSVFNENDICFSTIIAGATIVPITKITFLKAGDSIITNITPPISNYHELIFIPLFDIFFSPGGNIISERGFANQSPAILFYNPSDKKYWYIT